MSGVDAGLDRRNGENAECAGTLHGLLLTQTLVLVKQKQALCRPADQRLEASWVDSPCAQAISSLSLMLSARDTYYIYSFHFDTGPSGNG